MKLIIHDLEGQAAEQLEDKIGSSDDIKWIGPDSKPRTCLGCFGCWVRTPGACIIKDSIQDMGEWIAGSDEIVIVSECVYGSYSPFIRTVLDRSIPYLLPFLTISKGEMHHMRRYKKHSAKLQVLFYGDSVTEKEKRTAQALVKANANNFYSHGNKTVFVNHTSELEVI